MPVPRMVIVAGPAGGGKSSLFPMKNIRGVDAWNNDDYRARLNGVRLGAPGPVYTTIPKDITESAGEAMKQFIDEHIPARRSFAYETTLRRDITFEQARRASGNGFRVELIFVAAGDANLHVERVKNRADDGGHNASDRTLREIYDGAMRNLVRAFEANRTGSIETTAVFHNPPAGRATDLTPRDPECIVEMVRGTPVLVAPRSPAWFETAVRGTQFELANYSSARDDREHGFGLLQEGVKAAMKDGFLQRQAAAPLAVLFNGAMNDGAAWMARHPGRARQIRQAFRGLLEGMLTKPLKAC